MKIPLRVSTRNLCKFFIKRVSISISNMRLAEHRKVDTIGDFAESFYLFFCARFWDDDSPAPFVKQSRIQLGMKLREHHHLAINNTVMIIDEISYINIKDNIVQQDGYVDIESADSIAMSSLDSYH